MESSIHRIRDIACQLNARVEGARALSAIEHHTEYTTAHNLTEEDVECCIIELLDIRHEIQDLFDLADTMESQARKEEAEG